MRTDNGVGGTAALNNDVDHRAGARLNQIDTAVHLLGRDVGTLGQCPHFASHYGKTAALLAGSSRLDGCVERQQVGLISDIVDLTATMVPIDWLASSS